MLPCSTQSCFNHSATVVATVALSLWTWKTFRFFSWLPNKTYHIYKEMLDFKFPPLAAHRQLKRTTIFQLTNKSKTTGYHVEISISDRPIPGFFFITLSRILEKLKSSPVRRISFISFVQIVFLKTNSYWFSNQIRQLWNLLSWKQD